MADRSHEPRSHHRLGAPQPATPLVIAVPHAGRHYPEALLAASRLPREALETIEDRHADLLVTRAVAAGAVAIVATRARAWIDLNRDPREIDPASVRRTPDDAAGWLETEKVSGGLGVVPSRIAAGGTVWKRPLDPADIAARIATVHRPYHDAIAGALDAAQARYGVALLIDCHSMPPLGGRQAARLVIGDRYGASAGTRFAGIAAEVGAAYGLVVARNRPYAGGFTLDRHGDPRRGRHAIQIEVDRSVYLDPPMRGPGRGLGDAQALIAAIGAALVAATREVALAAANAAPIAAMSACASPSPRPGPRIGGSR